MSLLAALASCRRSRVSQLVAILDDHAQTADMAGKKRDFAILVTEEEMTMLDEAGFGIEVEVRHWRDVQLMVALHAVIENLGARLFSRKDAAQLVVR